MWRRWKDRRYWEQHRRKQQNVAASVEILSRSRGWGTLWNSPNLWKSSVSVVPACVFERKRAGWWGEWCWWGRRVGRRRSGNFMSICELWRTHYWTAWHFSQKKAFIKVFKSHILYGRYYYSRRPLKLSPNQAVTWIWPDHPINDLTSPCVLMSMHLKYLRQMWTVM